MSKKTKFDDLPDLLTTSQVMFYLNVSKRQVYLLNKSGAIGATNIARANALRPRYRFIKEDVKKLMDRRITFARNEIRSYKKYS